MLSSPRCAQSVCHAWWRTPGCDLSQRPPALSHSMSWIWRCAFSRARSSGRRWRVSLRLPFRCRKTRPPPVRLRRAACNRRGLAGCSPVCSWPDGRGSCTSWAWPAAPLLAADVRVVAACRHSWDPAQISPKFMSMYGQRGPGASPWRMPSAGATDQRVPFLLALATSRTREPPRASAARSRFRRL